MLKITKPAANRVDIELDGPIDADIMRTALDDLISKSEGVENGLMFYRIREFTMPTLGALGVEFSRLPKLLAMIGRFDRCAVLTDTGWMRKVVEVEGALIPGLAIKSFGMDEERAAEEWLAG